MLTYGSQDGTEMAGVLLSWEQQGTGAVAHVRLGGEDLPRVMRLSVPGRHMALNALGAVLAAVEAGAEPECVLDGLAGFEGVRRRFELVGTADWVRVYDDYAHHPTEVRATLAAVRTLIEQALPYSLSAETSFELGGDTLRCVISLPLATHDADEAVD